MADLIRKMQEGHTVEDLDTVIDEVYEARGEYDSLDERLDDMEGGAPTPSTSIPAMDGTGSAGTSNQYARADHVHPSDTSKQNALSSTQLAAVNSGINSTKVAQIETNKNNILSAENNILLNWEKNRNVYDWHNKIFITGDSTTITDNNNGTYTVTKSATTTANSYNRVTIHLDAGSYVLTGCPSGYSGIYMDIRDRAYATVSESTDSGSGSGVFTISTSGDYMLYIVLSANAVVSNIIFKPMITPSSVYYKGIPYQPYALSNAELTKGLYPTAYTKPTSATGIFLQSGGYCMIVLR